MGCGASSDSGLGRPLPPAPRATICVAGTPVSPLEYTIVGLLGDGALGRVYLCDVGGGQSCALKVMSKVDIQLRGIADCLATERDILLRSLNHPFVAQMHATFATPTFEYMAMEICDGSLFDMLYDKHAAEKSSPFAGRKGEPPHMKEAHARFYIAELLLGVEHIHSLGYVYRDMKPENCLVDRDGHVRVADFDQSAKLVDMQSGTMPKMLVGTPEYMAPEILRNLHEDGIIMGHGIDVWALGVLLFELTHGRVPFIRPRADWERNVEWTHTDTYSGILHEDPYKPGKLEVVTRVRMPRSNEIVETVKMRKISPSPVESGLTVLLAGMLCKDTQKRITLDEVRCCPWMKGVDWTVVKERAVPPPFVPSATKADRQRSRRRSVTKMLESDSLMRPNWDESARTSLEGLKPTDLLHHTTSDQSMNLVQSTPESPSGTLAPMPHLNSSKYADDDPVACELQDPTGAFAVPATVRPKLSPPGQNVMLRQKTYDYEADDETAEERAMRSDSEKDLGALELLSPLRDHPAAVVA